MRIVRKIDFLSAALPIVVKSENGKLATISSFESVKDVHLDHATEVEVRLEFFKTKFMANPASMLLVQQPHFVRLLSLLSLASLCLMTLVWGRNDILDYSMLFFPALYLITIGIYFLFARNKFLQVVDINS